ncbi:hypothetical protein C8J56DRAFT_897867 [Mycena floridula]|nr:hypothetical protein C8J56DRAFT_897867 [Mycena floridula]
MPPKLKVQVDLPAENAVTPSSPLSPLPAPENNKKAKSLSKKSLQAQRKLEKQATIFQQGLPTLLERTKNSIITARAELVIATQRRSSARKATSLRPQAFHSKLEALKLESLYGAATLKDEVHALIDAFEEEIRSQTDPADRVEEQGENAALPDSSIEIKPTPEATRSRPMHEVNTSEIGPDEWEKDLKDFQQAVVDLQRDGFNGMDGDDSMDLEAEGLAKNAYFESEDELEDSARVKVYQDKQDMVKKGDNAKARDGKGPSEEKSSSRPAEVNNPGGNRKSFYSRKPRPLPVGAARKSIVRISSEAAASLGSSAGATREPSIPVSPEATASPVSLHPPSGVSPSREEPVVPPLLPAANPTASSIPPKICYEVAPLPKRWRPITSRTSSLPPVQHDHSITLRASSLEPSLLPSSATIVPKIEISDVLPSLQWPGSPGEGQMRLATKEETKDLMLGLGDFAAENFNFAAFFANGKKMRQEGSSGHHAGHRSKALDDLAGFIVQDDDTIDPDSDYEPNVEQPVASGDIWKGTGAETGNESVKGQGVVAVKKAKSSSKKGAGAMRKRTDDSDIEREEINVDVGADSDEEIEGARRSGRGVRCFDKFIDIWSKGYEQLKNKRRSIDRAEITKSLDDSIIAFFAERKIDPEAKTWFGRIAELRPDAARMNYKLLVALLTSSSGNILCRYHFFLHKGKAGSKPPATYTGYKITGLSGPRRMKEESSKKKMNERINDRVPGFMSCGCEEFPALLEYILWKEGTVQTTLWSENEAAEMEEKRCAGTLTTMTEGWRGMVIDPRDRLVWYKLYMDTLGLGFMDLFTHNDKGMPIKNHEYNNLCKRIDVLSARKADIEKEEARLLRGGRNEPNAVASSSKVE